MLPWYRGRGNYGNERMAAERLMCRGTGAWDQPLALINEHASDTGAVVIRLLITTLRVEQTVWSIQSVPLGYNFDKRHRFQGSKRLKKGHHFSEDSVEAQQEFSIFSILPPIQSSIYSDNPSSLLWLLYTKSCLRMTLIYQYLWNIY